MPSGETSSHRMVIVTGASRGIGAAIARLAGARGYAVAVNYNGSPDAAAAVVRDIEQAGGRAVAIKADVGREADVLRLFAEATTALGPVTALVNNAGITGGSGRFVDMPAATVEEVLRLNVLGLALCAREAVRRMSTSAGGPNGPGKGGAIVNLSSVAASMGSPGEYVHYAASKGAVESLTIGLGKEVAREGIRVNAVAPGLIDTEIHATSGDPGRVDRIVPTVPMGRIGTAEEVAEAVLYLLSDAASYVTGAVLRVTGGR
jgi:NAD(P)-dependent dehydrogenase (short-subunit alcohol dehydrogenase family)